MRKFAILAFVGVVLMTASFVSPGWDNFNVNGIEHRFLPIPSYGGDMTANSAHLTAGVWYYKICVTAFISNSDGYYAIFPKTGTRCQTGFNSYDFEDRLSRGQRRHLLPEIQIMCSIAMFSAIHGLIGTIVYTRREEKYRWAGVMAFINLSIAGGTHFAAIAKTVKATPFSPEMDYMDTRIYNIHFYCPWGLVLGGLGCVLVLVSALGHLYILFRKLCATRVDVNDYQKFQGIYHGKSEPECHKTFGFKVPLSSNPQDTFTKENTTK